jgi:hypothetical protein
VPEKSAPRAIALYLELVLTSAEMLLDGLVPQHVALVCAHKIGISRSRYGRSEVSKLVHSLASAELAEVLQNGDAPTPLLGRPHNSRALRRRPPKARRRAETREASTADDPRNGDECPQRTPQRNPLRNPKRTSRAGAPARGQRHDAPSTNGAQPAGREPDDGEALDITYLQKITPDFEGIEP